MHVIAELNFLLLLTYFRVQLEEEEAPNGRSLFCIIKQVASTRQAICVRSFLLISLLISLSEGAHLVSYCLSGASSDEEAQKSLC